MIINKNKFEIKKLDSDNSFRLGVKIQKKYLPLMSNILCLFKTLIKIQNKLIQSNIKSEILNNINKITNLKNNCKTTLINGILKNEILASNLKIINEIIEYFKSIIINDDNYNINLYSSYDGKKMKYKIKNAYKKLSLENCSLNQKIKILCKNNYDFYYRLIITIYTEKYIKIFNDFDLLTILNKIVRNYFKDLTLILVDKKKGFKFISKIENIICNRITCGGPRCKIIQ